MNLSARTIVALSLCACFPVAAQTTATSTTTTAPATTTTTTTATTSTSAASQEKLVASFTEFAGSRENAVSLVGGLRTGGTITLTDAAAGGAADTTSFAAPTKPMGYGNVRIALSLAQAQLASQGITQPTAAELQTALMGSAGSTSTAMTPGILQMRADGMGWGQIANSMGFKLGAVMSGRTATVTAATTAKATTSVTTAAGTTTAVGPKAKSAQGITTAGGAGASGASHGQGKHSGIVTAVGGGNAYATGLGRGQGNAGASAGIVTAQSAAHGGQGQGGGKGKN